MATRIFCDLCNKQVPTTPPRELGAVAVIPPSDPYIDREPRTVGVKIILSGEYCDECKTLLVTKLITEKAYAETKIHRFGEKK